MSEQSQHKNILITIVLMTLVIVAVAVIGTLSLKSEPETIQGQIEVVEYRVSSKVPGRILELRVKEGDYVNVGDTLAILDAPEVRAKMTHRGEHRQQRGYGEPSRTEVARQRSRPQPTVDKARACCLPAAGYPHRWIHGIQPKPLQRLRAQALGRMERWRSGARAALELDGRYVQGACQQDSIEHRTA